ncbi:hypothetical protein KDL29_06650 [bacterium]|nr:hypothetical protein [bacterium]UNM07593.1 MAG: hypothetical protein H7A35_12075 [Planctomycetales bacterium]
MLRLSHFVYTLLLLIVMSSAAFAGHQADYTMKVTMDPAGLAGLASQFMPPGEEAPDMPDGAELPEDMVVAHGKVYWDLGHSRIDMFYDPEMAQAGSTEGLKAGDLVESFIMFHESNTAYQLLHGEKRAVMFENGMGSDTLNGDGPIGDMSPDRMIRDYNQMIKQLRETEGMQVIELPGKVINGIPVKGISFIMDTQALLGSMDGMAGMPDLSGLMEMGGANGDGAAAGDMEGMEGMEELGGLLTGILSMLGNIEGEMWYSDEVDIMMAMDMSVMGITTSMELDSLFNWEDNGSTFVVPDDYELITEEQYMQEQTEKINEMMKDLPGMDEAVEDYYDPRKDGAKISKKG